MPSPAAITSRAAEVLEIVISRIPYPNRIREIDFSGKDTLRFSWQEKRFRISDDLFVEEVDGSCLVRSTTAELLQALIRYEPL